jgi:hypothetical protein
VVSVQPELALEWPEGSYERYRPYFGRRVQVRVPVRWWSAEWHAGLRYKVYEGHVCSCHRGNDLVCLQLPSAEQGWDDPGPRCFLLKNDMELTLIDGND